MNITKGDDPHRRGWMGNGREDSPIHPELLCDHDILMWREAEASYYNDRKHEATGNRVIADMIRNNDVNSKDRNIHIGQRNLREHGTGILRTSY